MRIIQFLLLPMLIGYQSILLIQGAKVPHHPDSLYLLAGDYLDENKFEQAIQLLYLLEKDPVWVEDLSNLRKTYNNIGFSYYKIQKYDSSVFFYEKSNELAIALQDTTRIIASFNSLAVGYSYMGLYSLSLEKAQSALTLAQFKKDDKMTAQIHNTMALIYFDVGNITEAISNHQTSLAISVSLGNSTMVAYAYHNIARCHQRLGKYDSSLFYNKKALDLKQKLSGDNNSVVTTLNNIGLDFLKLDSLSLAEKYLAESNFIYKELNDQRGLVISYNNLSDLAIRRKQFHTAHAYLDSGALILAQINAKELLADHLELQVALMEKTGRHADALAYHKQLSTLKEKIFQEEKLNVQQVESSYLLREKELERANASQEAELAKAASKRNAQFIVFLLIGLLVAGMVAVVFVRLNRRLKESNRIIQAQKLDLKHSTYNTLMRIQALLRLTTDSMEDAASKEKLQQVEAAIISAASLQQFTYNVENEDEVSLGQFLEELVERLKDAFSSSGHAGISYSVEVQEDSVLPVKTVLNCGLIVGEIVTNAVKYAFEDIPEPKINLSLARSGPHLLLQVGDNGVGIAAEQKGGGIGKGLVFKLAKYIKADLTVQNEGGTQYTIRLKI